MIQIISSLQQKGVTLNLRKGLRMQSVYIQVAPVTAIQEEDIGLYGGIYG